MQKRPPRKGLYTVGGLLLVVAGLILGYVATSQSRAAREAASGSADEGTGALRVKTAVAKKSPSSRTLQLVGEAAPFAQVTIYAKVSGYLDTILVDKGDRVKKGQVLATIKAVETVLDYDAAKADAKNKRSVANRMQKLRERALASDQEAEQAQTDAAVAEARSGSLAALRGYEIMRAPFDGQVTQRFADLGALLQNAVPVVTVSTVDHLRVGIYVDQRWASFVKIGDSAEVWTLERPELRLKAKVSRLAGELDAHTKMLLVEIDLDNHDGALVAGSFVQVAVKIQTSSYVEVPTNALFTRGDKHLVSIVDAGGVVHYRQVEPGENDGTTLQLRSGLVEGERVALDLADNVADGDHVQIIAP